MDSSKLLFENFLSDKRVYILNQNYWDKLLMKSLSPARIKSKNWYNNQFSNGTKIYDGNPIYSLVIVPKKAIKIIQEKPECNFPEITAWISETEDMNNNILEELVISLELSKATKDLALEFVNYWIKENMDSTKMRRVINEKLERMKATENKVNPSDSKKRGAQIGRQIPAKHN